MSGGLQLTDNFGINANIGEGGRFGVGLGQRNGFGANYAYDGRGGSTWGGSWNSTSTYMSTSIGIDYGTRNGWGGSFIQCECEPGPS